MKSLSYFVLSFVLLAGCTPSYPPLVENTDQLKESINAPFYHGVASGDPTQDAVIIWTRITPATQLPLIDALWEVSSDETFQSIVASGKTTTNPERDYTVKVDVGGLEAGNTYYYRFLALDKMSPIGRMKTAPTATDKVTFGVVSCSNWEFGFFNSYGVLAEEEDIDAVLHLGDYIYEYPPGGYGDTTIGRVHIPAHELLTLQDYRDRYSQYRLDPDLQAAHGRHSFITIWDDHEISNNSYKDGAQNHQPDEGDYQNRRAAAEKAYYEWLPVRESEHLYRKFSYGDQVDLLMLDERLAGRTKPADSLADPSLYAEERSMLGEMQLAWFEKQLVSSKANWKVIGNQVIFSYLNWGHPSFSINLDSWDGYPGEQEKIANIIRDNNINNVVFVTGDTHTGWAMEVTHKPFDEYDAETGEGAYALEFGTTSINSGNSNERFSDEEVLAHEAKIINSEINPHVKYGNMRDHGYMKVELTDDEVIATWKYVETLRERNKTVKEERVAKAKSGSTRLEMQ
jgi:alkaline phosphatase D